MRKNVGILPVTDLKLWTHTLYNTYTYWTGYQNNGCWTISDMILIWFTSHWSNVDNGTSFTPIASGHVLHPQFCALNHCYLQIQLLRDPPYKTTFIYTRLMSIIFFHFSSMQMPALLSTISSPPNICLVRSNAATWDKRKQLEHINPWLLTLVHKKQEECLQ